MKRSRLVPPILMALLLAGPALAGQGPVCDVEVFKALLKTIDDGKGPQPLPELPSNRLVPAAFSSLGIAHDLQRKDSPMLCLECYDETGTYAWDTSHPDHGNATQHGSNNCARACIKMINSYYGGSLSQDRITYYIIAEYPAPWGALRPGVSALARERRRHRGPALGTGLREGRLEQDHPPGLQAHLCTDRGLD